MTERLQFVVSCVLKQVVSKFHFLYAGCKTDVGGSLAVGLLRLHYSLAIF